MKAAKSKKPQKPPQLIWFGRVSRHGLFHTEPIQATYHKANYGFEKDRWYVAGNEEFPHMNGNVSVERLGIDRCKENGIISFASTDKDEVRHWIRGVRAMLTVMREMSRYSYQDVDILE